MESYSIISSKLADESFHSNINYLEEFWTEKDVIHFIKKVDEVVKVLKYAPETFKRSENYKNIYQIQIVKQITLFYQINKNSVELLLFFNNYQNPNKLRKLLF